MTDRYLIPFGGRFLVLDAASFAKAVEEGARIVPSDGPAVWPTSREPQQLLTAEQMAELTGVPASWFLTAARVNQIPHVKFTKYVRFDPVEVQAAMTVAADRAGDR